MGNKKSQGNLKKSSVLVKKEKENIEEKEQEKEELRVDTGNKTCQTMEVAIWVKKMKNDEMEDFIDFMESIGFRFIEYKEPNKKELKGKILMVFFSYNSCGVCKIFGVERPLSMDFAMLDYVNTRFPNKIIDFHNINPRCDYLKSKEEKGVKDLDEGE